jgi:hypothetical protein
MVYDTIKKNAENLVVASKEMGLEINADKTNMSQDQIRGRSKNIKIDNSSFERVSGFGGLVVSMLATGTRVRGFKPRPKTSDFSGI